MAEVRDGGVPTSPPGLSGRWYRNCRTSSAFKTPCGPPDRRAELAGSPGAARAGAAELRRDRRRQRGTAISTATHRPPCATRCVGPRGMQVPPRKQWHAARTPSSAARRIRGQRRRWKLCRRLSGHRELTLARGCGAGRLHVQAQRVHGRRLADSPHAAPLVRRPALRVCRHADRCSDALRADGGVALEKLLMGVPQTALRGPPRGRHGGPGE